jgi:hypothetical protein
MALESPHPSSILLSSLPASAKTPFVQCLMKLHNFYFIDCSNVTKSRVIDYIFDNKPKYLLLDELDELDKLSKKRPNLSAKPNGSWNSI